MTFNGEPIKNREDFSRKFLEINSTNPIVFEIERNVDGTTQRKTVSVAPEKLEKTSVTFYVNVLTGFIFAYLFPTFCI